MPSTLKARREKAHKGESLRPDNKQAPPCYGSRCIVHNVWVFNAHWITTGRIFKYHCKRKLTAVCSHQTRIGNLDAHLI